MLPGKVQTFTPGPNGYVFLEQKPDDLVQKIQDAGLFYCPTCYSITKDLGIFSRPDLPTTGREVMIRWEVELSDLVASASSSCQFCPFMACRLFDDRAFTFVFSNDSSHTSIGCCQEAKLEDRDERVARAVENIGKFVEEHPGSNVTVVVQPVNKEWEVGKMRFTVAFSNKAKETSSLFGVRSELLVEFYAVEDSLASDFIKFRPINIDPASDKGIQRAQTWIEECLHNHPECPGPGISKLPARVIHIIDEENLVLLETSNEVTGSYTALSYAWGGSQDFALKSNTIAQLKGGFKVSELPQTLQDAVTLTKKLGHEYIWIDALCIIQDSAVDRNAEIPRMPDYYQNSYVTISAGIAQKATDGFLKVRDECANHPGTGFAKDLLNMPYMGPDGKVSKIYFREEQVYRLSGEPVCTRAWTLQERVLSPRVLIYGTRVVWQCNSVQKSDGGVEDWTYDLRASDHRRLQLQFKGVISAEPQEATKETVANGVAHSSEGISELWYHYVQEYSYLNLSKLEDKLPALSGLAIEINKLTGDEYLCGLWRSQLLRELMWSTYPDLNISRPTIWRAPSWSWASVNNQITFKQMPPPEAYPMAQIVDCSVTPVSSVSPFGEISAAKLRIKGPVMEFTKDDPQLPEIIKCLREENMSPPLRNEDKGLSMRRFMLNFIHHHNDDGDRKEWVPPEAVTLLVMFARPHPDKEEDPAKTANRLEDGDNRVENVEGGEEALKNLALGTEDKDLIPGFKNDTAKTACLVLVPKEDETYERIAILNKIVFTNVSKLRRLEREVEIS